MKSYFYRIILSKKFMAVFFFVVILLQIILVSLFHKFSIGDDAANFHHMGTMLSKGATYEESHIKAIFFPPAYPYFLGGLFYFFGASNLVVQIANVLLYIGSLVLLYLVSKELFHSEFAARIGLVILGCNPNHFLFTLWTSNELLFLFLFLASSFYLIQSQKQKKFLFLGGFLFGLLCLVKAQSIFLPLAYFTSKISWEKKIKKNLMPCLIVYLCLFLTLIPWTTRSYLVHKGFIYICTQGGLGLLTATHPKTDGSFRWYKNLPEKLAEEYDRIPSQIEKNNWARKKAFQYMKEDPLRLLKLWPYKLYVLYGKSSENVLKFKLATHVYMGHTAKKQLNSQPIYFYENSYKYLYGFLHHSKIIYFIKIWNHFLLLFFLISLYLLFFSKKNYFHSLPFPTLGIGFIVYFTALYMIFISWPRFSFPIIPWMAMYIGIGFKILLSHKRISYHINSKN